jgi:hypothetical protein
MLVHPLVIGFLGSGHPENHRPLARATLGQLLAMILIILSLVAALIARYPFAVVAAHSPL